MAEDRSSTEIELKKEKLAKDSSKIFTNIASSSIGSFSALMLVLTLQEVGFSKLINNDIATKLLTGFISGAASGILSCAAFSFFDAYNNDFKDFNKKDAAINGTIMFATSTALVLAAEFLKQKVSSSTAIDIVINISAAVVIALLNVGIIAGKEALQSSLG